MQENNCLRCYRCLINTGVEKMTTFKYRLELWPTTKMSLIKSKCLYSNYCLECVVQRYLRKVGCSKHISLWCIRALVSGTKQSRQAWNRLGSPDCPVNLLLVSHLSCWPACFVLSLLLAVAFQTVFLAAPNSPNQTNKTRGTYHQAVNFLKWCLWCSSIIGWSGL